MGDAAINLDYLEGEQFPYTAKYIGWSTPPIHPRLGLGGAVGENTGTYSMLIQRVLKDLQGYLIGKREKNFPEVVLSEKFRGKIGRGLESLTKGLLSEEVVGKLIRNEEELRCLIRIDPDEVWMGGSYEIKG